MVRLFAVFQIDVEIAGGFVGEGLEELLDQHDIEIAHHRKLVIYLVDESLAI